MLPIYLIFIFYFNFVINSIFALDEEHGRIKRQALILASSTSSSIINANNFLNNNLNCMDRTTPGRGSDCPANQALCNNPIYFDLMTVECPFTCKRCGQRPSIAQLFRTNVLGTNNFLAAPVSCLDRIGPDGKSDCPSRQAFCRIPIWQAFMRLECPFTCNVCGQLSFTPLPFTRSSSTTTTRSPLLPQGLGRK